MGGKSHADVTMRAAKRHIKSGESWCGKMN